MQTRRWATLLISAPMLPIPPLSSPGLQLLILDTRCTSSQSHMIGLKGHKQLCCCCLPSATARLFVSTLEILGSKCWRNKKGNKLITEEGNITRQDDACTMPLPNHKESLNLSKWGRTEDFHFPFLALIIKVLFEVQRNSFMQHILTVKPLISLLTKMLFRK